MLLNNGHDNLTVQANGSFTFATPVAFNGSYVVTAGTQPTAQTCTITSSSGTMATSNITNVDVSCVNTYTVGGTVTGLVGSVTVTNGSESKVVSASGSFTFATALTTGANYSVVIGTQPSGQTCTAANGSGIMASSNVTNVAVSCTNTYTVGVTVTGLMAGQSVILLDNGGDGYTATASGAFTFATAVATGASYAVTVGTQPTGQACTVSNGSGTMSSSNVTNVGVNCLNRGESVLYSFTGGTTDGAKPIAGLILDASGNLYGTTQLGGASSVGTVFKLAPDGSGGYATSVLYSFTNGPDGSSPQSGLVLDASGNLYGTTTYGGASSAGTVFKITSAGVESVLYSFTNGPDGAYPYAGLVLDASGNLYGTTNNGGASNQGTVFKITAAGLGYSVLHSLAGGTDGANPQASLVLDASGNLYGTTYNGGANSVGTVFKIAKDGTGYSVLHSFAGGTDGANPQASLVLAANGNLYGTTQQGGANSVGTMFKIASDGTGYGVLHTFGSGSDGAYPDAGLALDASGNLYGTTGGGGGVNSYGTVFKITAAGVESVLYSFVVGADGWNPWAGLVLDASGNMYGTTWRGGSSNRGTVFRIVP